MVDSDVQGSVKTSLLLMYSFGVDSNISRLPVPTESFPDQMYFAPTPVPGPVYSFVILGSMASHGLHASRFSIVFTCSKTTSAGASIIISRSTLYSVGLQD